MRDLIQTLKLASAIAFLSAGFGLSSSFGQFLTNQHQISSNEIKIGMSNLESGNETSSGISMKEGCLACFRRINAEGGIYGRKLSLIAYDDHYDSLYSISNTERLINTDRVFALLGYLGSAPSLSILPMVNESRIVYLGPLTGTPEIRDPMQRFVFSTHAGFKEEAETLIEHLMNDLGIRRIALFITNDQTGSVVERVAEEALVRHNLILEGIGLYARGTGDLEEAVDRMGKVKPEAVLIAAPTRAAAEFIQKAKAAGLTGIVYACFSPAANGSLVDRLGADGEGVVGSQIFPSPEDPSIPLIASFQRDMRASGFTSFDYPSLAGYLDGVVLAEGLKAAGRDVDEEKLCEALNHVRVDAGTFSIAYSESSHSGSDAVFLTEVIGGKMKPVSKLVRVAPPL